MDTIKNIFSIIGILILGVCGITIAIIGSFVCGLILRFCVYFICFILQIFGDFAFVDWVDNHHTATLVICSLISALGIASPIMAGVKSSDSGKRVEYKNYRNDYSETYSSYAMNNMRSQFDSYLEEKRCRVVFADASGAYRKWGDDFVDCKGNWCKWGEAFYDYDGNYIRWGNTYKDMSGAYRRWGDDFIDGNGDWVHL